MDYQKILEDIYTEVKPYRRAGHQADYIPALERVNPDQFGMSLTTVDGRSFHVAESEVRFSIQSISKVYSLALCLSLRGEKLWERVGKEPSGNALILLYNWNMRTAFRAIPLSMRELWSRPISW